MRIICFHPMFLRSWKKRKRRYQSDRCVNIVVGKGVTMDRHRIGLFTGAFLSWGQLEPGETLEYDPKTKSYKRSCELDKA